MGRRPPLGRNHVRWEETSRLGLGLGSVVGQLDATTNYVTDDRFDMGKWDALHRKLTVVDAYSAAVGLEELQRGRVDVIIQAFGAEELYLGSPVQASSEHPIPGVKVFEHVFKGSDVVERVEANLDEHRRFADAYDEYIEVALTEADIRRTVDSGKIAMVLMLISGLINNDLRVLRRYHELGVRVMAPCHMGSFDWSDSTAELRKTPGLSEFGREVITECNTLGVLVDLAHASDQTCWDTLDAASEPVIATHTKCRALSNSVRDMSDDIMQAIADQGGVVGILAYAPRSSQETQHARMTRDLRLKETYPDPFELAAAKLADAEVWGTKLDLASIDHAVNLVGIDHVGLSSHQQNVPQWKEFTEALIEHGYGEEDSAKILGENVLRVLREALG